MLSVATKDPMLHRLITMVSVGNDCTKWQMTKLITHLIHLYG